MPLPLICPVCSGSFPAEAGLQDAEARKALAAALDLPASLAVQVIPYLGLHAPPQRRIKWDKLTRIITELNELVRSGEVTRSRETRPAPLAAWSEGLATVLEMRDAGTLDLPLDGHGLLCEIVHRRASKTAARQQAENRPLHASHRPAMPAAPDASAPPPLAGGGRGEGEKPAGRDWSEAKRAGAQHVGALLGALKRRTDNET